MLKRPSHRAKKKSGEMELNLVPLMDAMVTLICFLLFTSAFLAIHEIESPAPLAASDAQESRAKNSNKPPLNLTIWIQNDQFIIDGGFGRIWNQQIPLVDEGNKKKHDFKELHNVLIKIKKQFPEEDTVVLKPDEDITYEILVKTMDASRSIQKEDGKIDSVSEEGVPLILDKLFPKVVFGNTMS